MSKIKKIVEQVLAGESSAEREVEAALQRAKADDTNCLLEIISDRARERAAQIDGLSDEEKKKLPLLGVPFVAKDNFLTFGSRTTAASKILENFKAPLQATAVEKLEAAGAICIGKANLDAFAHGGSTENSAFGVTKNAVDEERVAGGSSGGSAVAVARGIVPFALGSDTGGSIRQPASFNGVVGWKPSYGLISRFGVVAMASSTDVVGPITHCVEDAEILTEVLAGQDDKDSTLLDKLFKPEQESAKPKIGVVKEWLNYRTSEEVKQQTKQLIQELKKAGYEIEEIDLPMTRYAVPIYYIVVPAELSSNLARYDGIRYGVRSEKAKTLQEVYLQSRSDGFVDENKRRLMIGAFVLSSGFFDDYYIQAQKARTLLIEEFKQAFEQVDILLGPTVPYTAWKIGEHAGDPLQDYLADLLTVPASLAGLPAISLPNQKSSDGLPIGVQLVGSYMADAKLLAAARSIEKLIEKEKK